MKLDDIKEILIIGGGFIVGFLGLVGITAACVIVSIAQAIKYLSDAGVF